jgi:hypothetical protein
MAHGQQASRPGGVGGPYRAEREYLLVAAPPPGDSHARPRRGRGLARSRGGIRQPCRSADRGGPDAAACPPAVVALRLVLDLDTSHTAELLGITPNTVMAHMARALAALREDLQPERQQETRS